MNCASCQAQLAPGSTHCYACGSRQPSPQPRARTGASGGRGSSAVGSQAWQNWSANAPAASESWRVWASFFLGGLYGPVASLYLAHREEWAAGLRSGALPPATPSQRGFIVLGLFVGLPVFFVSILGFVINASEVRRHWDYYDNGIDAWIGVSDAWWFAWVNLLIAGFYLVSVVLARMIDRRFAILLSELTGGDPQAMLSYRRGRFGRIVAAVLGVVPFALVAWMAVRMRIETWAPSLDGQAVFYLFAVTVAAWATSWLHVSPVSRFRDVLVSQP